MKVFKVIRIPKKELLITGKGDSNLWNTAETLIDFCSPWKEITSIKTTFKALWDGDYLFFNFKVVDDSIHIDDTDNSFKSINVSDRVELFFRENSNLDPYYCLEIDPTNRLMDFKARPNKKFDFNWHLPMEDLEIKSSIDSEGYTVEGKISIHSMRRLNLIQNNKIETGIFRAKYFKNEALLMEPIWFSWVNPKTKTPNFHTPSSFGFFNLETD